MVNTVLGLIKSNVPQSDTQVAALQRQLEELQSAVLRGLHVRATLVFQCTL